MSTTLFRRICLLAGAAAIAVALILFLQGREPVHGGKPLSYWVAEIQNPDAIRSEEARQAIREIGPRAVPFFLEKARKEESLGKRFHRAAWERGYMVKMPGFAQRLFPQPKSKDGLARAEPWVASDRSRSQAGLANGIGG